MFSKVLIVEVVPINCNRLCCHAQKAFRYVSVICMVRNPVFKLSPSYIYIYLCVYMHVRIYI